MKTRIHPWKAAARQAGGILLASVVAAVAFNAAPPAKIPWIRELPPVTEVSVDSLLNAAPAPDAAPAASLPADTAAAPVDTVASADTATPVQSTPADTTGKNVKNPSDVTPPAKAAAKGIGTDGAFRLFQEKKALFIDARPADQFAKGHIPGAINIYAEAFEPHIPQLLGYPMDTLIVAYCGGGLCELSHELAAQLGTLGFKRVVVYTGGTNEWTEKKLPFTGGE